MSTGGGTTRPLSFTFKKKSDGTWEVRSFRDEGYVEPREVDLALRDLSHHPALNVEDVTSLLASAASSKTLKIPLDLDTYLRYNGGAFTTEYDRRTILSTASSSAVTTAATTGTTTTTTTTTMTPVVTPVIPTADPATNLPQFMAQMLQYQQQSNMQFMHQQQATQMQMMSEITAALGNLATFSRSKKMEVTKYDGQNSDARTWLLLYERAAMSNGWLSDAQKVNNLKSCFVPSSSADRWYSSKILSADELTWEDWKDSFVSAFTQNRIESCRKALNWEYRSGPIMNYYYEKERLLQIAFPHLDEDTLVTLVIFGLPSYLHPQVLAFKPEDKEGLIAALQTLVPKNPGKEQQEQKRKPEEKPKPPVNFDPRQNQLRGAPFMRPRFPGPQTHQQQHHNQQQQGPQGQQRQVNMTGSGLPVYDVMINGVVVSALLDSGAACDVVSANVVSNNNWKVSQSATAMMRFDGSVTSAAGTMIADVMLLHTFPATGSPRLVSTELLVVEGLPYEAIIGDHTMQAMGIQLAFVGNLEAEGPEGRISSMDDVKRLFPQLLNEDREPRVEVPFLLKDTTLVSAQKPYRLSRERGAKVTAQIEAHLKRGWLRHSNSPFAAPVVPVMKPNGDVRVCQDYRSLNKNTTPDPFPMPLIDNIIVNLGGCNWFSKIDLKDAFRQIGLTEETRKYTAFVTGTGYHVEHTRLPFGWINSPAIFQRHITRVLGDLLHEPRISCYVDDLVVGAKSKEENERLTFMVMKRLDEHGMIINASKSELNQNSVTLLGRVIDGQIRTTRTESIEKVRNMNRPVDLKSVQQFTGLTNHFRDYIPNYAAIVRPIDRLKRKDTPFVWTEECERSFKTLVDLITSDPILSLPDWSLDFELCTDASDKGCGSLLYQRDPSKPKKLQLRVIGYQSHTFTPAETNYNVSEKEMLAVILAIKYFRSYLEGRRFIVHSDHQALSSVMNLKEAKGRLSRWQVFLMSYNMEINYRKGTELKDADAVSRLCLSSPPVVCAVLGVKPLLNHSDKQLILRRFHDDPDSGGHDGVARTIFKLKPRFGNCWPNMRKDVEQHIKTCNVCQITKFKFRPKHNYLVLAPQSSNPYESVHLDFGEVKKKSEGCKTTRSFILLVDEYTRMIHTRAMRQTARSVIQFMESLPFLGQIKRITQDNGPAFASKEFKNWAKEKGIKLTFSAPFNPLANGFAERRIRDVKTFMKCYPQFKGGWKECLGAATKHQNRSYHSAIGCSPYFKAHGKSDPYPADVEFGVRVTGNEQELSNEVMLAKRKKVQQRVNAGKPKPQFQAGEEILFCRHDRQQADGPIRVKDVIMKENVPKTLLCSDDTGNDRVVAVRNAIPYKRRNQETAMHVPIVSVALLLMALLPLPATAVFVRESPLLWDNLNIPVMDGFYTYDHKIILQDPCGHLDSIDMVYSMVNQHKEQLAEWCRIRLKKGFWENIKKICKKKRSREGRGVEETVTAVDKWQNATNTELTISRSKRFPILVGIAAVALLTAVVVLAFGIATSAWLNTKENRRHIEEQEHKLDILRQENLRQQDALRLLTTDSLNLTRRLTQLETDFHGIMLALPAFTTTITDVGGRLEDIRRMSENIVSEWKEQRMAMDFFKMFNTTDKLMPLSILAQAEPLSCRYNEAEGFLRFTYQIPVRRKGAKLLEADPFILYQNQTLPNSNQTAQCKFAYGGARYAMLSDQCVYTLDQTEVPKRTTAYVYESTPKCLDPPKESTPQYKPVDCQTEFTRTSQIRFTKSKAFVYCPKLPITVDQYNLTCPDYVFSLPRSTSFTIGTFTYSTDAKVVEALNFSLIDNMLVSSIVYPAAGQEDLGLAPGLQDLLNKLDVPLESSSWSLGDSGVLVPVLISCLGTFIVTLGIGIGWIVCRKKKRQRRNERSDGTGIPLQPRTIIVQGVE